METPEVPLERTQEDLHRVAEETRESWVLGVALTAAVLAVLAAITALLSEHHANEAMIEQIQSSDLWNYYQAKSIKANLLSTRNDVLVALGKTPAPADLHKFDEYKADQEKLSHEAREKEADSRVHLHRHTVFSRGVTMFQVAIAIGAIGVLIKRRMFWFASLVFGMLGLVFLVLGFLVREPAEPTSEEMAHAAGINCEISITPRTGSDSAKEGTTDATDNGQECCFALPSVKSVVHSPLLDS